LKTLCNWTRGCRSLRGGSCAVAFALILGLLAACNQLSLGNQEVSKGPDIMDRVRSLDLLPRSPQQTEPTDKNAGARARPQVYAGVTLTPIEGARSQPGGGGEGYELNFENTPIASVAKVVLGDILGTGYTIDPRVQGTVSLASGRPVPKSDLLFVLENALRLSGVVLVKDVQGYRLIPLGDAVGAGNLDSAEARAEPGYGISVVSLRYVSASTLIKLIDSFATKPGTVRADTTRNLLIIQGSGAERRAAIETVLGFDVDWMRGQSVGIFPIRYSNPEPVITELEKILDSGEGGLSQNIVKFQVIARLNAILVVSKKPDLVRAAETWIRRLDNSDTSRTGVHVYRVKYGEARQLARVLNDIFVGGSSGSFDTPANQVAPRSGFGTTQADRLASNTGGGFGAAQTGAAGAAGAGGFGTGTGAQGNRGGGAGGFGATQSTLGSSASGANASALDARGATGLGGGGGNQPILEGVRITADVTSNALLIYASTENYQIIERTLSQLDRPQLQVAIDATVAEVTLNDNLSYGVQFFLQSKTNGVPGNISNIPTAPPGQPSAVLGSQVGSNVAAATGGISTSTTGLVGAALNRAFPGFNFLIGSDTNPNVILDALHAVTTLKVLSNPSVVVIDNQVATLMVGSDVPISTGSANVLNAATAASNTIVNTIDYRTVGIILRVVPRINANGNVRLDIEQEISNVTNAGGTTTSNTANLTPTVSQRKVKSSIAIANGQTVLLAGLIQEQQELDRGGIPLLDQIPKLGDAFSHQTRAVTRTELIVFIRPQIIRDSVDAHFVAEELRTKLRGTIGPTQPDAAPTPRVR
jgi:general secretion pathway protein D